MSTSDGRSSDELETQVRFLESEITELRRRLGDAPAHSRGLELRLADTQRSLAAVTSQNERLAQTLREARDQIMTLKDEVDRLAQPPASFGTFLARTRTTPSTSSPVVARCASASARMLISIDCRLARR